TARLRVLFFLFQAEDGIRDLYVSGVQTCALPISTSGACAAGPIPGWHDTHSALHTRPWARGPADGAWRRLPDRSPRRALAVLERSEERRVGKECRERWWWCNDRKKGRRRSF